MFWKTALLFLAALLPFSAHAGTFVQFRTSIGDIAVELYDTDKPVTVTNFLHYVKKGYTNDMIIHRVAAGFYIQGGLFYIHNRQTASPAFATIPLNPAIVNEYATGRIYSNTYGTLAMSKEFGQANSAQSQWFFNLANNSTFDTVDGGYTVFGRVIGGFDVLNLFLTSPPIWSFNAGGVDSRLTNVPVTSTSPTFNDLVYVDITLLNIRISNSEVGKVIQWRSAKNVINTIQYTTVFPPVWQTLASPFGNGNDMAVTDTSGDPKRFYRIKVAY